MLRWQLNQHKSRLLLKVLCSVSIVHVVWCSLLFMVGSAYRVVHVKLHDTQRLQGKVVVIVPITAQKRVQGVAAGDRNKGVLVKKNNPSVPKSVPKKVASIVKKSVLAKKSKKNLAVKKKDKAVKKHSKKDTKKVAAKKSASNLSKPLEKPLEKPIEKKEEVQTIDAAVEPESLAVDASVTEMTRQEYEAYVLQEQIHQEIVRCWHPPAGLDPRLECTFDCFVGDQGKVEQYTLVKSSGNVAFDISARSGVKKSVFPQGCFGKHICLTFKQG